jgi:hypothetical protein
MFKKTVITLLLIPTFSAFADDVDLEQVAKDRLEWTKKHFAEQGSPMPDSGVTVLPEKQMSQYARFKDERAKQKADIKKYGYINQSSPDIDTLLNFKIIAKKQAGSELKESISAIDMAYDYRGVPAQEITTSLGFAPSVTFVQGKGWAGVAQFFEKAGVGTCSYRENNLKFSHGAAVIPEEDASREVNGKVTVVTITGMQDKGFIYSVDWYDDAFFGELKCANTAYSPGTTKSVINLAQAIDNNR